MHLAIFCKFTNVEKVIRLVFDFQVYDVVANISKR